METNPITGICGDNLKFRLQDGVLQIEGCGMLKSNNLEKYRELIEQVIISPGCTYIDRYAFSSCPHVTSVTIPETVIAIGPEAFSRCKSLISVTIPDSIEKIHYGAFSGCEQLRELVVSERNPYFTFKNGALFSKDFTELIRYVSTQTIDYKIPNDVTKIGDGAFFDCYNLKSITIPDNVAKIGFGAFKDCHSLTSVTIPKGVTEICKETFMDCWLLTSVSIPDSVAIVNEDAFTGCSELHEICISEDNPYFTVKGRTLLTKDGTKLVRCLAEPPKDDIGLTWDEPSEDDMNSDIACLNEVTIPECVTEIGESAFKGCWSLTSVSIPKTVKYIDNHAFWGCNALTSLIIPDSVTWIGCNAFYGVDHMVYHGKARWGYDDDFGADSNTYWGAKKMN